MEKFQVKMSLYEIDKKNPDAKLPLVEVDVAFEAIDATDAGKKMIEVIKTIRRENKENKYLKLKFESVLLDEDGMPLSLFADD